MAAGIASSDFLSGSSSCGCLPRTDDALGARRNVQNEFRAAAHGELVVQHQGVQALDRSPVARKPRVAAVV